MTLRYGLGDDAEISAHVGSNGEVGVNTTTHRLHLFDGITAGGIALAKLSEAGGGGGGGSQTLDQTLALGNSSSRGMRVGVVTATSFSGTATTATNLADAANITTGTINSSRLSGTYNIGISGNAATATYASTSGVSTYASLAGIATSSDTSIYASTSGIATHSSTAGVSTYALTAGIATNAQGLTGNPNITVTNATINGILSVGGTTIILNATQLHINDKDIIVGYTTDANGVDVSTDTTANHGGIAIASTIGTPLINIDAVGIDSIPNTYKQIMWIKSGTLPGLSTDAWVSNYPISIGNTATVQNGSRLTVGAGFTVYENYIDTESIRVKNINIAGIATASNFSGSGTNLTGIVTSIIAGTNITVSNSTGQVTINSTAAGGGSASLDALEVMLFT